MSCSLLKDGDWLDAKSDSDIPIKIMYMLLALLGGIILGYEIYMESQHSSCENKALSNMFRILSTLCIVLVIVPIVILATFGKTESNSAILIIALGALALIALVILALVIAISIEYPNCNTRAGIASTNVVFPNTIWFPVGALILVTIGTILYKYKTRGDSKINVYSDIDWANMRANGAIIEELGQYQGDVCKVDIPEGASTAALQNYLTIREEEFYANLNPFTRKFKKPKPLPKGKIPNIVKMFGDLQSDYLADVARKEEIAKKSMQALQESRRISGSYGPSTSGSISRGFLPEGDYLDNLSSIGTSIGTSASNVRTQSTIDTQSTIGTQTADDTKTWFRTMAESLAQLAGKSIGDTGRHTKDAFINSAKTAWSRAN